jgi:hypothetical protein
MQAQLQIVSNPPSGDQFELNGETFEFITVAPEGGHYIPMADEPDIPTLAARTADVINGAGAQASAGAAGDVVTIDFTGKEGDTPSISSTSGALVITSFE